jgi:hypothetical protein
VLQEEMFLSGELLIAFVSCVEPLPLSRRTTFDFSNFVMFMPRFGFDC